MVDRAAAAIRDDRALPVRSSRATWLRPRPNSRSAGGGWARPQAVLSESAAKVRPPEARLVELGQAEAELAELEGDLAEVRRLARTSPAPARARLADLAAQAADLAARASRLATGGGSDLAARGRAPGPPRRLPGQGPGRRTG